MEGIKQHNKVVGGIMICTSKEKQSISRGIKCSPYEAMFGVSMKLGNANLVLSRNLTINMTTE